MWIGRFTLSPLASCHKMVTGLYDFWDNYFQLQIYSNPFKMYEKQ